MDEQFDVVERRAEKQARREQDEFRLRSGETSALTLKAQNGFFSALDRTAVRIVHRRVRLAEE